jgi:EAL domain-containing protein (putative c-di-GMP-specific phosphodiesterase class I)
VLWVWRRAVLQSRLVHRLSHALRKRQFEPFVQPIVDLQTGRCTGAEVLMRWNHPQRGILGPGEFIEEAERTGLILGMSDLTMSLAAHRLATVAQADPGLYFSFNVTPGQLREPGFAQRLAEIFRPDTVPRDQVLLEVTERDFVDPRAKGRLLALRADGWRIAIDDFGTGQSSLASIESLPVDRIKIDRAFVSSIDEKTVNRPVLDTIIQLSRDLRVPLIAEGIETRSQWDYLRARGVANAQGYLMARPMPIAEFLRWLAQHAARAEPTAAEAPGPAAPPALPLQPGTAVQRALWQRMRAQGGLPIRDRVYKLRNYPQCFVGSQAVDWMVAQLGVSRAEALRQGRALVAVGLVQHVLDEHDFNDGDYFYRLAPASAVEGGAAAADASGVAPSGARLQGALDVPWRSHRRGLLRHHRCASGRELVDWIVNHHPITRATARDWAALWMRQGTLRHVFDSQPFRDDQTLYRLG